MPNVLTIEEVKNILNIGKPDRIEFCLHCVMRKNGWKIGGGNETELGADYLCPIAYYLRCEYNCPINKYQNREELREEIDRFLIASLDEKEKIKLLEKILEKQK